MLKSRKRSRSAREFPWGAFHGPYPYPEREPISANAQVFRKGCKKLGIRSTVAPLAILSAPFDGRPPSDEKDEYGIPRAQVQFSYGENDRRLIAHGIESYNQILEAAGGKRAFVVPDNAHLMGGCRMGNDPKQSVVNAFCQSHDIPNLYICDASVFVTLGGANPTQTVMAIASRTADHLIGKKERVSSVRSSWKTTK